LNCKFLIPDLAAKMGKILPETRKLAGFGERLLRQIKQKKQQKGILGIIQLSKAVLTN